MQIVPTLSPQPAHAAENKSSVGACSRTLRSLPRQVKVLMHKNLLVLRRNFMSTTLRLFSCVFFMLLMWIIIGAINSSRQTRTWVKDMPHPPETRIEGISPCTSADCVALAYSPAPSKSFTPVGATLVAGDFPASTSAEARAQLQRVHAVIRSVMENNFVGGAVAARQVQGFTSAREMEEYILLHPNKVKAAVLIDSPAVGEASFTLQVNSTTSMSAIPALQVAISEGITRAVVAPGGEVGFDISLQEYAHPKALNVDVGATSSDIAPLFIFSALLFPFVMQMAELALDKETKIRQTLRTVGMLDSAYWISWHLFHTITSLLTALLITVVGIIFRFELFVNIDFAVLFFTFFFFSLAMNGVAYLLSSFLHTSAAALWVGVCSFFVGFILFVVVSGFGVPWGVWPAESTFYMNCSANALFDPRTGVYEAAVAGADNAGKRFVYQACSDVPPENTNYTREIMYLEQGEAALAPILSFFPPALLCKTLSDLGKMASNDTGAFGLHMHNVTSYCFHNISEGTLCDADYAVGNVWGIWVGLYVLYSLLGIYLDNVLPDVMGDRKPWAYCLMPSFWNLERPSLSTDISSLQGVESPTDPDVLREEAGLKDHVLHAAGQMDDTNAVEVCCNVRVSALSSRQLVDAQFRNAL